jgi:hypothetical protein
MVLERTGLNILAISLPAISVSRNLIFRSLARMKIDSAWYQKIEENILTYDRANTSKF